MITKEFPKIQSGWSLYMEKELKSYSDVKVVEATPAICRSWGDKRKWDNPVLVISRAISDIELRREALLGVAAWAAGGSAPRHAEISVKVNGAIDNGEL